jgi:hypothetical protein
MGLLVIFDEKTESLSGTPQVYLAVSCGIPCKTQVEPLLFCYVHHNIINQNFPPVVFCLYTQSKQMENNGYK